MLAGRQTGGTKTLRVATQRSPFFLLFSGIAPTPSFFFSSSYSVSVERRNGATIPLPFSLENEILRPYDNPIAKQLGERKQTLYSLCPASKTGQEKQDKIDAFVQRGLKWFRIEITLTPQEAL